MVAWGSGDDFPVENRCLICILVSVRGIAGPVAEIDQRGLPAIHEDDRARPIAKACDAVAWLRVGPTGTVVFADDISAGRELTKLHSSCINRRVARGNFQTLRRIESNRPSGKIGISCIAQAIRVTVVIFVDLDRRWIQDDGWRCRRIRRGR